MNMNRYEKALDELSSCAMKKTYDYDLKVNDYLVCVGANSQNLFRFIKKELGDHVPIEEFEKFNKEHKKIALSDKIQ